MISKREYTKLRNKLALTLIGRVFLLVGFVLIYIPATALGLPFTVTTSYIAKKKAKEGLDANNINSGGVKVAGRDVMATWKLLCAILILPNLHILYSFSIFWWYGETAMLGFFFFWPFVSYYNYIMGESIGKIARSLRPLWLVVFGSSIVDELELLRRECVERTVRGVDELGFGIKVNFGSRTDSRNDLRLIGGSGFGAGDESDGEESDIEQESDDDLLNVIF